MNKPMYRVADYVADFMTAKDIKNVYSLPGGGAMHLMDAFTKNKEINHISFFHEQGASIAAEAASRTAGNAVGVCCVTTGPGATNAITAVAGAWIESSPLIVISGQVKTSDMLGDRQLRQTGVQEVQISRLVDPITKFCHVIESAKEVPAILDKAYTLSVEGRKGPVWIDIPLDIQGSPIQRFSIKDLMDTSDKKQKFNTNAQKVFELLQNSDRPLLFFGNGSKFDGVAEQARDFINTHMIPSVFTWNASDILAYENKMNMGRPGVVAQRHANFIVQKSDLIIAIGTSLDNVLTAYNPTNFAPNAKKVFVNIDEHQLTFCDIPNIIKVHSSAKDFLADLDVILSENKIKNYDEWIISCNSLKRRFENDFPTKTNDNSQISHRDFVLELSDALNDNQIIATGSSGLAIEAFYMMFRNKPGQKFFLTSGLGSMGFGLPQSIGIAIENPGQSIVLVESDGSLAMNIQELQTISNLKLPVCIILMNNSGYASIRNTQSNYFENRFFGTGKEAGQDMPDWEKIASAYGFEYASIEQKIEIKNSLDIFYKNQVPTMIDVKLVENELLQPKCAAIPQADGSILSMPLEDMTPLIPLNELREIMGGNISEQSKEARK